MSRILILTAAVAVGAVVAVSAAAHPAHGPGGPGGGPMMMMMHEHLAELDKNKDGFIGRDEFLAHPSQMFDKLDANHDGRVSKDEMAAMAAMHGGAGDHHMMMMHHMAEMIDADHDSRISFAEVETAMRDHFKKMDKNGDGFVTKDEMPGDGMMIEKHIEKHD